MQFLKDVAKRARYLAMLPPTQIPRHWIEQQDSNIQAFDSAVAWSIKARELRKEKRVGHRVFSAGQLEAMARVAEARVREIALQSEIILQRRADLAQADRAMLGILLGVAS